MIKQVPEGFQETITINSPKLVYNIPGTTYICVEITSEDTSFLTGTCDNVMLKYVVKDCDPSTGQLLDDDG